MSSESEIIDLQNEGEKTDYTLLQMATFYLMTRYSQNAKVAYTIVHHLQYLVTHPDTVTSPSLQHTYQCLLRQWRAIVDKHNNVVSLSAYKTVNQGIH